MLSTFQLSTPNNFCPAFAANAEANIPLPPTALVQPFRPASTDLRAESHSSCEVSEHFSSESSPPDTYIGDPLNSFEMKSSEVTVPDREPSVIEESGRENSENVVLPGYVVRRRGSILKNPNTKVCVLSKWFCLNDKKERIHRVFKIEYFLSAHIKYPNPKTFRTDRPCWLGRE